MRNFSILSTLLLLLSGGLWAQPASGPALTASAFYERGTILHDQDQLADAIDFYTEAIRLDKRHTKALYNRGLAYYVKGKFNKALFDFDRVLALQPDDQEAIEHRARIKFLLKDNDGALSDYTMVVSQNPNCILHVNRGIVHLEKKQFELALEDFEAALGYDSNDQEALNGQGDVYYAFQQYDKALICYQKALELNPEDARTLNNQANVYKKLGRKSQALATYDKAIHAASNTNIYVNRGFYALEQGNIKQALADCEKASQLDYRNDKAYYGIGLACIQMARYERANENLEKAIELNNTTPDYFTQKGIAAFHLNQLEEAKDHFEYALQLGANPLVVEPYLAQCGEEEEDRNESEDMGAIEEEFGLESFDLVEGSSEEAGTFDSFQAKGGITVSNHQNKMVNSQVGFIYSDPQRQKTESSQLKYAGQLYRGGRYEKTIAICNQILRNNPEQFAAYYQRGQAFTQLKQHQAAIDDYTEAISFHNHYTEAFYYRANAFMAIGMHQEAIADYNIAEKLDGSFSKVPFMRAQAYAKLQEVEKAIADYDKYLGTNPEDIRALNNLAGLYWRTGNIFGAMETYNRGLRMDNYAHQLRINRGRLHYQQDDLELALRDFSVALKLGANTTDVYYYRGVVHYELKHYDQAINDFTEGLRGDPQNAVNFYYRRALAHHHNGAIDSALADYDQVLERVPNHQEALHNRRVAETANSLGNHQKQNTGQDKQPSKSALAW